MKKTVLATLAASALLFGADTVTETELKTHTELSYIQTSGNTDTTTFALDFNGKKSWDLHTFRADAFANTAEDSGVKSKNQWGVELNYDYKLTETLSFNYLVGYKDDAFSGFDYQFYTGPGLVHRTYESADQKLVTQGNILYAADAYESGDKNEYVSFKAGLDYEWKIQENLKLVEKAHIRTDLSEMNNFFFFSKTSLQSKINSTLSMGVSYKIDYMNEPAAGKSSTDKTFMVALVIDY